MVKNKQSARSFTAFAVTWSFLVLTVTGTLLYILPQGRIAAWTRWSWLGLEKEQWGALHMMFGGILIIGGALHLYFNWKPFVRYIAERARGHLRMKRELVTSLAATVVIGALSIGDLPPVSWLLDLNATVKESWVSAEVEPPFGHAEEVSLSGLARRLSIDLESASAALREAGIAFSPEQSLTEIGITNDTTPMAIYALLKPFEAKPEVAENPQWTEASIEDAFTGTGIGGKAVTALCEQVGIDAADCVQRLGAKGIATDGSETARQLAGSHDLSPIDLLKRLLLP